MLAAVLLSRAGCRVLVLPARPQTTLFPGFLLPLVKGYPARLLSRLLGLMSPPAPWLTVACQGERIVFPVSGNEWGYPSAPAGSRLSPEAGEELAALWRLLDDAMRQGFEMPVSTLKGSGRMLWLVLRDELLRTNRTRKLSDWLAARGAAPEEIFFWQGLVPLFALMRFADPPLPAFAYGLTVLSRPEGWVHPGRFWEQLLFLLRNAGAEFADYEEAREWRPVFDGKWFIGVGRENQVCRRVTAGLFEADPAALLDEIEKGSRRGDFLRQFRMAEIGYRLLSGSCDEIPLVFARAPYHLENRARPDLLGNCLFAPAWHPAAEGAREYRWQGCADNAENIGPVAGLWGGVPRLPAMMGGGYLPLQCGYRRFYQVGWGNLPGFGLGGLVYSAWQAARAVWVRDLLRDTVEFENAWESGSA